MDINGRKIAKSILDRLKALPPPKKALMAFMTEGDPMAESFLRQQVKFANKLGVDFKICRFFPDNVTADSMTLAIQNFSSLENIGGIIISWPLPRSFDRATMEKIINLIPPEKDPDRLRKDNRLIGAPAAKATLAILNSIQFRLAGKNVAVLGTGNRIGTPIYEYLHATSDIFVCKVKKVSARGFRYGPTEKDALLDADVVIIGAGMPDLVTPEEIKEGAVILDFAGGAAYEACRTKANYITPPRGGCGPVVVACLFENFYILNQE